MQTKVGLFGCLRRWSLYLDKSFFNMPIYYPVILSLFYSSFWYFATNWTKNL